MQEYGWFALYKKAVTEVDPQKQVTEIELALSTLAERTRELRYGDDTSAEQDAIFAAASTLNNLRSFATEMIERSGGYLRTAA